jgi:hypothetical protein
MAILPEKPSFCEVSLSVIAVGLPSKKSPDGAEPRMPIQMEPFIDLKGVPAQTRLTS